MRAALYGISPSIQPVHTVIDDCSTRVMVQVVHAAFLFCSLRKARAISRRESTQQRLEASPPVLTPAPRRQQQGGTAASRTPRLLLPSLTMIRRLRVGRLSPLSARCSRAKTPATSLRPLSARPLSIQTRVTTAFTPRSLAVSRTRPLCRALSTGTPPSAKPGQLCCPNCGSALVLAESLAEAATPPQMDAHVKPAGKEEKTQTSTSEFKKGDVVKCSSCNLHFALKSHPGPAPSSSPSPPVAPHSEPPRYRNPAAAAALSSLSSSLSSGIIQTRGSSIGSTGSGSAAAAGTASPPTSPSAGPHRPPIPSSPSSLPGRRMNGTCTQSTCLS